MAGWHDFGHIQTYFRSRRIVSSARHFNNVKIDKKTVTKSSSDSAKMEAEWRWFTRVPPGVQIYSARLLDYGTNSVGDSYYATEYNYLPTLSELFVYGAIGVGPWSRILASCRAFLEECASVELDTAVRPVLFDLTVKKTADRLSQFQRTSGFDVSRMLRYGNTPLPSLVQIAEDIANFIKPSAKDGASIMHGDFCFSNILYDSRVGRIRVIDPRGYVVVGQPSIFGDQRYDLSKFVHSVYGRYDQIICGRYHLECTTESRFEIEFEQLPHQIWLEKEIDGCVWGGISLSGQETRAICVSLFLSMLPLHSDRPDRQRAFIANALRLYRSLEKDRP